MYFGMQVGSPLRNSVKRIQSLRNSVKRIQSLLIILPQTAQVIISGTDYSIKKHNPHSYQL